MNVIVTGASSGIGFATVKELAKIENANIVAIARRHEGLAQLQKECGELKGKVAIFPFDLAKGDFEELYCQLFGHMDSVDVLLNNAGYLFNSPVIEAPLENIEMMMAVNFFSTVKMVKLVIPLMKDKGGHIVNIGSMAGIQGSRKFPGLAAYGATKAAVHALSETLAVELAPYNVAVNSLALGAVQTDMLNIAFPGHKSLVLPDQVAPFVADFCVNGQKYFNGKVLPVSLSVP